MEEINFKKFLIFFTFIFLIQDLAFANIYKTNCKTVEKKNSVKSLSFVFSFERKSIVVNQINNKKIKYKINISKITDRNNFLFDAEDEFFKLEFKPGFSYLKKNNSNPKFNLVSNDLTGININCSAPKLIKTEVIAAELPKDEKMNGVNEEQIKKILKQLQSGKEIDKSNLNELMSTLQKNNAQSNVNLGQLQGLLQSQSFMGQLTKGNLLEKLTSEEFLKMITEEFKKLTKQNP